jgi:transcription antitermination factor NusG
MNYILEQIKKAEENHDIRYKIKVKFIGSKNSSNCLDLTQRQLERVKSIFEVEECCGKEMKHIPHQNMLNQNEDVKSYVCFECGRFINIIDGQLDEEELENVKENYED